MVSNRRPFSFNLIFGNRNVTGWQIRWERWVGDDNHLYFAMNCWVRTEVWDGVLSWWSSHVCSRQSSGRRLHVITQSSQQNPEFAVWPVGTGASRYHNCCIDGSASPEYFGSHFCHVRNRCFLFQAHTTDSQNTILKKKSSVLLAHKVSVSRQSNSW
jgi:hypothetical protein